jgi:glycosyltransferase involved in cell wall biosynthesis
MIVEQKAELSVLTASTSALGRPSERLRLKALAARNDISLSVIAPEARDRSSTDCDPQVISGAYRRWLPGLVSGRLDTIKGLGEALASVKPDVLHVHQEPGSLLALQALRLRDQVAPATAVVVESEQADMTLTTGTSTHIERFVLRRVEALVVRHKVRLELSRAHGFSGNGIVAGFGVDTTKYRPGLRNAAREALGVAGFTIGYLGQLQPESGLADVLEAIAAAKCSVNLIIKEQDLARGKTEVAMRDEIAARATSLDIADRVRFIEPHEAVDDVTFLSSLDALVLMRRSVRRWREPYEHVIPEAQACGTPVIAAGLSGIPTLVGTGGWIVGERDAGLLARLLQRLATQPEVAQAVSAAALTHASQHASLDAVTHELRRAFDTAVQARQLHLAGEQRGWRSISPLLQGYRR